MDNNITSPNFIESTISFYYLIASADGKTNQFESKMYEFLKSSEGISDQDSKATLLKLNAMSDQEIFSNGVDKLNECTKEEQVKCLAWMNKLANSDGRLDDEEWSIIYQVYKKELDLTLEEILDFKLPELDFSF